MAGQLSRIKENPASYRFNNGIKHLFPEITATDTYGFYYFHGHAVTSGSYNLSKLTNWARKFSIQFIQLVERADML
jgi:hypothetical protein